MNKLYYDVKGNSYVPDENSKISFRPGIYTFIENNNSELLLIVDAAANGEWEIPGGGLDVGEDMEGAAVREVNEETGFDIKLIDNQPFFVNSNLFYYNKMGTFTHRINLFFRGKLLSEKQGKQDFADSEEILKVEFVSKDKLLELNLAKWQKDAIDFYLKNF